MIRFLTPVLIAGGLLAGDAFASARSALVIGNGAYADASELPNPPNDARAMAATLEAAGFQVTRGIDLDKAGMERAVASFLRNLPDSDVGLVFYAGHGLQVDGRNYLVPIDATLADEVDVAFQTVALDEIQAQMEKQVEVSLLFLDACRDNPLARNLVRSMGKSRSAAVGQGLAESDGAVGALVAYATQPDNVALDGQGSHSPFTSALLTHLATPGLEIRQILTRVRKDVIAQTEGRQVPWDHSSLTSDVYIQLDVHNTPAENNPETAFWQAIAASDDAGDFQAYLDRYGEDGLYGPLALNRIERMKDEDALSAISTGSVSNMPELPELSRHSTGSLPSQQAESLAWPPAGSIPPPPERYKPDRRAQAVEPPMGHRPPPPRGRMPPRP